MYYSSFQHEDRDLAEAVVIVVLTDGEVDVVTINDEVKVLDYVLDELPLLLVGILSSWLVLKAVPKL